MIYIIIMIMIIIWIIIMKTHNNIKYNWLLNFTDQAANAVSH